jgi:hypothetical protein
MILLLVGLLLLDRFTVTITWTRKGGGRNRAGSGQLLPVPLLAYSIGMSFGKFFP